MGSHVSQGIFTDMNKKMLSGSNLIKTFFRKGASGMS